MLNSTGFNERGEPIADINGLNIDRRSQRVRRATVEIQTSYKPAPEYNQRQEVGSKNYDTVQPTPTGSQRQSILPKPQSSQKLATVAPAAQT